MAEQAVGKEGQGSNQERQSEILNLPKYGALYGRFLLASLPGADVPNIIDPAKQVKFDFDTVLGHAPDSRNYNPVFENFSLNERKEQFERDFGIEINFVR